MFTEIFYKRKEAVGQEKGCCTTSTHRPKTLDQCIKIECLDESPKYMYLLWYGPVSWIKTQKQQWSIHVDTEHRTYGRNTFNEKKLGSIRFTLFICFSFLQKLQSKLHQKTAILVYCLINRGQLYYKCTVCQRLFVFYSTFQSYSILLADLWHVQKLKVFIPPNRQPSLTGNTCCFRQAVHVYFTVCF